MVCSWLTWWIIQVVSVKLVLVEVALIKVVFSEVMGLKSWGERALPELTSGEKERHLEVSLEKSRRCFKWKGNLGCFTCFFVDGVFFG